MDGIEKRMRVMADPGNSLQPSYGLTRLESDSSCVYTHSVSKLLFCGHLTPGGAGVFHSSIELFCPRLALFIGATNIGLGNFE